MENKKPLIIGIITVVAVLVLILFLIFGKDMFVGKAITFREDLVPDLGQAGIPVGGFEERGADLRLPLMLNIAEESKVFEFTVQYDTNKFDFVNTESNILGLELIPKAGEVGEIKYVGVIFPVEEVQPLRGPRAPVNLLFTIKEGAELGPATIELVHFSALDKDNVEQIIDPTTLIDAQFTIGSCEEGAVQDCGVTEGICTEGVQICDSGAFSDCISDGVIVPLPGQVTETCNGIDDDCDGVIDEGEVCPPPGCAPGTSECVDSRSRKQCNEGGEWSEAVSCGDDQVCEAGVCVTPAPACIRDTDCGGSSRCVNSICVSAETPEVCSDTIPCPSGKECEEDVCITPEAPVRACVDPDALENDGKFVKSTTSILVNSVIESSLEDECNANGLLKEAFCLYGTNLQYDIVSCPDDYVCNNGACVAIECSKNPDCAEGYSCVVGVCTAPIITTLNGDLNGDGSITLDDAIAIARHVLGIVPLTDILENVADVDCDGSVTMDDAIAVAQVELLGMQISSSCGGENE